MSAKHRKERQFSTLLNKLTVRFRRRAQSAKDRGKALEFWVQMAQGMLKR